jgi:hypothetical protein
MPYIPKCDRGQYSTTIEYVRDASKFAGHLNYILFAAAKTILPSYTNYRNYIGELNECVAEIRRRLLAPYENQKIKENSDV